MVRNDQEAPDVRSSLRAMFTGGVFPHNYGLWDRAHRHEILQEHSRMGCQNRSASLGLKTIIVDELS